MRKVKDTSAKRGLMLFGSLLIFAAVILGVGDIGGFLPSLPRTLGQCKADALQQLVSVKRNDNEPITSSANLNYYARFTEVVQVCMESHGYRFDEDDVAGRVVAEEEKSKMDPAELGVWLHWNFVQAEKYWHKRWFWQ